MSSPHPRPEAGTRRRALTVLVGMVVALVASLALLPAPASAQEQDPGQPPAPTAVVEDDESSTSTPAVPEVPDVPEVRLQVESDQGGLSQTVVIMLLVTIGSVAPAILLLMTSFTRYVVVLSLTRNALGVQTVPPGQVLIGLALFLSFFTMGDVFSQINDEAIQPMLAGEISQTEAIGTGFEPLRDFMLANTRDDDLQLFIDLSGSENPGTPDEVSATTLIPAYVISELRAAFLMGFVIFVPFLVIDLVVAAVLMSMGMMMLPPVFISMPLKLLLFVLVDGWVLITGSLVQSVQGIA